MNDLAKCPFCGHRPQSRYSLGRLVISCDNSKCQLQPSTFLHLKTDSVAKTVTAWNKRMDASLK